MLFQFGEFVQFSTASKCQLRESNSPCATAADRITLLRGLFVYARHRSSFSISRSSVSRIIRNITETICRKRTNFVNYPKEELVVTKRKFYELDNFLGMCHSDQLLEINKWYISRSFPGVLGCIDGTHVPIEKTPTNDFEEYWCSNMVVHWKGAKYDSRILCPKTLASRLTIRKPRIYQISAWICRICFQRAPFGSCSKSIHSFRATI